MAPDTYNPARDISDEFLATVVSWIRNANEVFVVLRYLRAGGAKDYAFVRSEAELQELIGVCPVGTDIIVFRDPQLPLRAVVDDVLISNARALLPEWKEYLYVVLAPRAASDLRLFGEMGDQESSLLEDLGEHFGETIAIGACPDFNAPDNAAMISRSKAGIDGPR
jgi:hypothetical protein